MERQSREDNESYEEPSRQMSGRVRGLFSDFARADVVVLLVKKCSHAVQVSKCFRTSAGGGGEGSAAVSIG